MVDNELPKHQSPLEKRLKALKEKEKEAVKEDEAETDDDDIVSIDSPNLEKEVEFSSPNRSEKSQTLIDDREKEIFGRNKSPPTSKPKDSKTTKPKKKDLLNLDDILRDIKKLEPKEPESLTPKEKGKLFIFIT